MYKCKRVIAVLSVVLIAMLSATPVSAKEKESDSISVVNTVGLDNVHIEINQYDVIDGERDKIAVNPTVLPGQVINRVCEISNLANDAWIRTKVVYTEDTPDVGENFLTISSDKWKKQGEYYYYTEPVNHNDTIEFFNKVNIPAEWDNSVAGKKIDFTVYADAVQVKNFTPDFDDADPWFGTIIEHRIHDDYIVETKEDNDLFKISYEGGSEGLVKIGDDFFSNWGVLMPGDVVKDSVLLKNNYALPTTIYFRINTIDNSKLLERLQLHIYMKDKEIYQGSLLGDIKNEIELIKLKQGETAELFYELSVPSELTNEFSLSKTKTEWVFRAYSENMKPPSPDAQSYTEPSHYDPDNPNNPNNSDNPQYTPPGKTTIQTGDVSIMLSVALAIAVALLAFYIMIVKGGGKREKK